MMDRAVLQQPEGPDALLMLSPATDEFRCKRALALLAVAQPEHEAVGSAARSNLSEGLQVVND